MAGGTRGPATQSAAKNRLKGNPGKRSRKTPAAKILPSKPFRPGWLSVEARAEWDRVVPQLAKLKLLCQLDQPSLAAYCQAVANVRSTSETIAKIGLTFTTKTGYLRKNPAAALQREAMQTVLCFAREFGLTPAARARLDITPGNTSDAGGVTAYAKSKGH